MAIPSRLDNKSSCYLAFLCAYIETQSPVSVRQSLTYYPPNTIPNPIPNRNLTPASLALLSLILPHLADIMEAGANQLHIAFAAVLMILVTVQDTPQPIQRHHRLPCDWRTSRH